MRFKLLKYQQNHILRFQILIKMPKNKEKNTNNIF